MKLTARHQAKLHRTLVGLLDCGNKFVRAWTYNGFGLLACADDRWRNDALERFEAAQMTESAAVKARSRNVVRELRDR